MINILINGPPGKAKGWSFVKLRSITVSWGTEAEATHREKTLADNRGQPSSCKKSWVQS